MRRAALAAGLFVCCAAVAAAQPPSTSTFAPLALRPGHAVDLNIGGANLAAPTGLWTSLAAAAELAPGVEKNGTLADRVVYRVTTPAEAAVGIAAVRVTTGQGTSSLRAILVDDLESAADNGQNHTAAAAQPIGPLVGVDGVCDALASDFYKLSAKAGQSVSIEVVARRLGSLLDAVLRLTDAQGRELAFSDDEPGGGGDPRLRYTFAADGDYLVELRDVRHQGGGGHYYRLRVGDFPLVATPYPLAVQPGTTASIAAVGPTVEGAVAVSLTLPADAPLGARAVAFKLPGGQSSGFATLDVMDSPQAVEAEPNDAAEQSTKVAVPGGVNGRLEKPRDRDFYEFTATKGQRLRFIGRTRTHGSPSDLLLRVTKADGGGLGEADDAGAGEGELSVTFPEDGAYRLAVEDLHRRGGPEHAYRIDVLSYRPGFSLSIDADKLDVPQEGSASVKVTCGRRDYNGPIELAVEGLGDGVVLEGNTIPEGKPETQLRITLPGRITAGQLAAARIVGRAKIGEQQVEATASTLAALRKLMPETTYPAATLEGAVAVGVGPVYPPFFELSVDGGRVEVSSSGGAAEFKVSVKRLDGGFKAPIAVAVENLPPGVTAEVTPVGKGEAQYTVTLKGPEKLPEPSGPLRIVGTGTHNNQTKRVTLDGVPLVMKAM